MTQAIAKYAAKKMLSSEMNKYKDKAPVGQYVRFPNRLLSAGPKTLRGCHVCLLICKLTALGSLLRNHTPPTEAWKDEEGQEAGTSLHPRA